MKRPCLRQTNKTQKWITKQNVVFLRCRRVPPAESILIGHGSHFLLWLLQWALLLLQDQKIYIYSLKGMCPLSMPQQALDTPAVVTCFLAVPVIKKVRWERERCSDRSLWAGGSPCRGQWIELGTVEPHLPGCTLPRSQSALETQVTIFNYGVPSVHEQLPEP